MNKIDFNLEQEATDEMLCARCKRVFGSYLLQRMCINGVYSPPICAICALKVINKMHGLPAETPFRGEMAQDMYDRTEEYLLEQEIMGGEIEQTFNKVVQPHLKKLKGDIIK